jgi:hypothetical protein
MPSPMNKLGCGGDELCFGVWYASRPRKNTIAAPNPART